MDQIAYEGNNIVDNGDNLVQGHKYSAPGDNPTFAVSKDRFN